MDKATIAIAAGMRARIEALDLLANNVANSSTTGYKADKEFYGIYRSEAALRESGDKGMRLPSIDARWTDFSAGTVRETGSPADLALTGEGFFVLNSPSGPRYTRNGHFQLSPAGGLISTEGYSLRLTESVPLNLRPNLPFQVAADGAVSQGGEVLGHIQVVTFDNLQRLDKLAGCYFQNPAGLVPQSANDIQVHQARLEDSNANPAEAAVRLVSVMRQFESLQKALRIMGEMSSGEVAKVS